MTDTEGPNATAENDNAAQATDPASTAPETPDSAKEAKELKDKLLRALAEMENLRRRTARELADERLYGIAKFARDVLGAADNMRRALETVTEEMRAATDPATSAFIEGVELTERELLKALEKHGIKKIEPAGEKFNPNFHEAMYEIPDPSLPAGHVAQVVQPGYVIGERVVRPALVGVAKGGPKPESNASAAQSATSNSEQAD